MFKYFFFFFALMIMGCQANNSNDQSASSKSQTKNLSIATSILKDIDSLQILYYDDPNGDSLRYSRFYRFISLSDSITINQLQKNLSQPFETLPGKKDCRSDGKIYAYGQSEVVKTIYFNTTKSNCKYLYYIQNGSFIYFKLDEALKVILINYKKNAIAPQATSSDSIQ